MESMCTFPKDTRIWWSTLPGKAGKSGANAALVAARLRRRKFWPSRKISIRGHVRVIDFRSTPPKWPRLRRSSSRTTGDFTSILKYIAVLTPGPKLQTVTLSLKTHSSISVSVGMCVDPPDCGVPLQTWRKRLFVAAQSRCAAFHPSAT